MGLFGKKEKKNFDWKKTIQYFESKRSLDEKNFIKCPFWLSPVYDENGGFEEEPDQLWPLCDPFKQRKFYTEGKVALGVLVQANEKLFQKGIFDLPANYIYTTDMYYYDHPEELIDLAYALFDTKGGHGYLPSIQTLADILEDEIERVFAYKLPRNITEGRDVYFTSVLVCRKHLAEKKIVGKVTPLIVLENEQPDAMILPHWFWAE